MLKCLPYHQIHVYNVNSIESGLRILSFLSHFELSGGWVRHNSHEDIIFVKTMFWVSFPPPTRDEGISCTFIKPVVEIFYGSPQRAYLWSSTIRRQDKWWSNSHPQTSRINVAWLTPSVVYLIGALFHGAKYNSDFGEVRWMSCQLDEDHQE